MSDGVDLTKALDQLLPGPDWLSKPETIMWLLSECSPPRTVQEVEQRMDGKHKLTDRSSPKELQAEFDALVLAHNRLCSFASRDEAKT
jgi:hypothetical protein